MTTDLAKNHDVDGVGGSDLERFVPTELRDLGNAQTAIPRIARDPRLTAQIETAIQGIPTSHSIFLADSRIQPEIPSNSVHLVLTSPPHLTLKEYRDSEGQMGHIENYELFLNELDEVWQR